jgi:hypothetical protein
MFLPPVLRVYLSKSDRHSNLVSISTQSCSYSARRHSNLCLPHRASPTIASSFFSSSSASQLCYPCIEQIIMTPPKQVRPITPDSPSNTSTDATNRQHQQVARMHVSEASERGRVIHQRKSKENLYIIIDLPPPRQ